MSSSPSVRVGGQQGRCHPLGCLTASPGLKESWVVCATDFSGANPAEPLSYISTLYYILSCSSESHLVGKYVLFVMSLQMVSFSPSILSFFLSFLSIWGNSEPLSKDTLLLEFIGVIFFLVVDCLRVYLLE